MKSNFLARVFYRTDDAAGSEAAPVAAAAEPATKKKAVKKSVKKKVAKKKPAKKAPAKKGSKKGAKKAASTKTSKAVKKDRDTVRVRALRALNKGKDLTAAEVMESVGIEHGLKPTLDQEVERGHLTYAPNKGDRNLATYRITAKGSRALEQGTVNPKRGE